LEKGGNHLQSRQHRPPRTSRPGKGARGKGPYRDIKRVLKGPYW